MDAEIVHLPISWVLGAFGALAAVVATLATTIWVSMKDRLATQDRIIDRLQDDVDRLSKGCGIPDCNWRIR